MKRDLIEILTLWGLHTLQIVPNWFYILQKCQGLMIICIQHASLYLSRVKVLGWRSSKQNHLRMFSFHCTASNQNTLATSHAAACLIKEVWGVRCEHERKLLVKYFVSKESRWRKDEVSPLAWLNLSGWLSCAPRYQLWYNGESNLVFVTFGQDPDWGGEERRGPVMAKNEVTRDITLTRVVETA